MRKLCKGLAILFLVLLILLGLLWTGKFLFEANFVILEGQVHSLGETELDLSGRPVSELEQLARFRRLEHLDLRGTGLTLEQQQWLQKQLPDCRIDWEIQFQGAFYPPDTQELTISDLTVQEVELLDLLPELAVVEAGDCRDYGALQLLEQRHPGCEVRYSVELGGQVWERSSKNLILQDVSRELLSQRLPSLPQAEEVTLTGKLPAMKEIRELEKTFPGIDFRWIVELGGVELEGDARELVLTGSRLTEPEEFVENLPYFPEAASVDLRGTGLDNDQKQFLTEAYPGLDFRWEVAMGSALVDADAEEAELSVPVTAEEVRQALPYLKHLKRLVLRDSGLSNEELDGLNQELTDVRIVWNLDIGGYQLLTDDLYFAPNNLGIKVSDEMLSVLKYCTDMVCVDVGHNLITGCEWASSMPQLRYLVLADSKVADISPLAGLENLKFLELFQTPVKDYSPLLECTGLEDLNLCYTYGDPAPVMEMTWLKRLWWTGARTTSARLSEHLPYTQVECSSYSSTGAGWREGQHYYDMRDLIGMDYMTG